MATEAVEVANEREEDIGINCVAIFYEEGKEGEDFRKKNKFLCYSGLPRTCGFGFREKILCSLRFFGIFLCGFAVSDPSYVPPPPS